MRKIVAAVVVWSAFLGMLSVKVQGQSCKLPSYPPECVSQTFDQGDAMDNPPASRMCCNPSGVPFNESCMWGNNKCAPPNAAGETCLSCSLGKTVQVSVPIDLATGNTYITQTDISIPGLGGGLRLARTWNSLLPAIQNSAPSMFGPGWRSTYEERLIFHSSDIYLKYARSDGSVWSFGVASTSGVVNIYTTVAPANDSTTITQTLTNGVTSWLLTFKNGEKRTFDPASGALLSMIDRNGNTTQLAYDAQGRLTTVTDPASRHLNFTYASATSNLVTTAASDVGITYSYLYDGQGRLSQITKPDTTTISFQYDTNSNITAVLDANGKVLEQHTYDVLNRGLTGSRANGVEKVTVHYPQ
jgi:YD repeat-containing protein